MTAIDNFNQPLRGPKYVHCLFLFHLAQGKYNCHYANVSLFCVAQISVFFFCFVLFCFVLFCFCLFCLFVCYLFSYVIVFFCRNQISNGAHFKCFLIYFSHFLQSLGHKNPISTYIHSISPYLPLLPSQLCKNCEFIMYDFSFV